MLCVGLRDVCVKQKKWLACMHDVRSKVHDAEEKRLKLGERKERRVGKECGRAGFGPRKRLHQDSRKKTSETAQKVCRGKRCAKTCGKMKECGRSEEGMGRNWALWNKDMGERRGGDASTGSIGGHS